MRTFNPSKLVAGQEKQKEEVAKHYNMLWSEIIKLESMMQHMLLQLNQQPINDSDEAHQQRMSDISNITCLISLKESIKQYLSTLEHGTFLGFTTNKVSEKDADILSAHVKFIGEMNQLLPPLQPAAPSTSTTSLSIPYITDPSSDIPASANAEPAVAAAPATLPSSLSSVLEDTKTLSYNPTTTRIWLRRAALALTAIAATAVVLGAVAALMTPGVNIAAAIVAVPLTLKAAAAFFRIGSPVAVKTSLNFGLFQSTISTPMPSTLGNSVGGVYGGASLTKRFSITRNPKEIAARNIQTATVHQLVNQLKEKLAHSQAKNTVKAFLDRVIDKADALYDEGASCYLHERRVSKTSQARELLTRIATYIETGLTDQTIEQQAQNYQVTLPTGNITLGDFVNPPTFSFSRFFNTKSASHNQQDMASNTLAAAQ